MIKTMCIKNKTNKKTSSAKAGKFYCKNCLREVPKKASVQTQKK